MSSCDIGMSKGAVTDRQFIFVNRRAVDYPRVINNGGLNLRIHNAVQASRILNEVYASFNRGHFSMLVLFVEVDPCKLSTN